MQNTQIQKLNILAAIVLALGIAIAGFFVGTGIIKNKTADRYVSVRGSAEKEVEADFAVWNLKFVNTGNDLPALLKKAESDLKTVTEFLEKNNITNTEYDATSYDVIDQQAQLYRAPGEIQNRYIVSQNIMITSNDTKKIAEVSKKTSEVINAGVILYDEQNPSNSPQYYFTKLNDSKPEMIAEATKNARAAAEQFAKDSGAQVGQIRTASQGLFSINAIGNTDNYQYEMRQRKKQIRVVTTIEFYLN